MNKYVTLMLIMSFLVIVTLVADSALLSVSDNILDGGVVVDRASISNVWSMISTWFKIITFQLPEIPLILNIMVFYPLSIGVVFMLIDILKDLIPFT